ncbi:hypothetical protein D3C80_1808230 [compost metagenome]
MHKLFKQLMGVVQIFTEFLTPLLGIFTKQRQRAFELAGGVQLYINIILFQQAVEVGDLRHNTN